MLAGRGPILLARVLWIASRPSIIEESGIHILVDPDQVCRGKDNELIVAKEALLDFLPISKAIYQESRLLRTYGLVVC